MLHNRELSYIPLKNKEWYSTVVSNPLSGKLIGLFDFVNRRGTSRYWQSKEEKCQVSSLRPFLVKTFRNQWGASHLPKVQSTVWEACAFYLLSFFYRFADLWQSIFFSNVRSTLIVDTPAVSYVRTVLFSVRNLSYYCSLYQSPTGFDVGMDQYFLLGTVAESCMFPGDGKSDSMRSLRSCQLSIDPSFYERKFPRALICRASATDVSIKSGDSPDPPSQVVWKWIMVERARSTKNG